MEHVQNKTIDYKPKLLPKDLSKSASKRAKNMGILSIVCAMLAIAFLIAALVLPMLSKFTLLLYFEFLLLTAFLSSFGFLEISSAGNRWLNLITSGVSGILILVLFVLSLGELDSLQLWGFYFVFSILTPLLLTITAFSSNNLKNGKAFTPLVVPMFLVGVWGLSVSKKPAALIFLPVGWAIIGLAAFAGNDDSE